MEHGILTMLQTSSCPILTVHLHIRVININLNYVYIRLCIATDCVRLSACVCVLHGSRAKICTAIKALTSPLQLHRIDSLIKVIGFDRCLIVPCNFVVSVPGLAGEPNARFARKHAIPAQFSHTTFYGNKSTFDCV